MLSRRHALAAVVAAALAAFLGTLFGALIVGVYQSGIALAGVQSLYQVLAEGILVIVAVALDQWIRKVRR